MTAASRPCPACCLQRRESRLRMEEAEARADRAELVCRELQLQVGACAAPAVLYYGGLFVADMHGWPWPPISHAHVNVRIMISVCITGLLAA